MMDWRKFLRAGTSNTQVVLNRRELAPGYDKSEIGADIGYILFGCV